MHRYFITGTDTDVGKTVVTAGLALALRHAGRNPTIVKLVQTGVRAGEGGDAQRAGELAGVPCRELVRYAKAADAWSAALAEGATPPAALALSEALEGVAGDLVAEGLGGLLAPLNENEHLGHVAARAKLHAILVVNLRLGCISHALLTLDALRGLELPVAGTILTERCGPVEADYRTDVERVLRPRVPILGSLPYLPAERESAAAAAMIFEALVNQGR